MKKPKYKEYSFVGTFENGSKAYINIGVQDAENREVDPDTECNDHEKAVTKIFESELAAKLNSRFVEFVVIAVT